MASSLEDIPLEIAGYTVLVLYLPSLPSLPQSAIHYLYLAQHQPKVPTPTAPRSLFLVNILIDATEAHFKSLFSTQLGLPAGRIESIQFEGQRKRDPVQPPENSEPPHPSKRSKKRKRGPQNGNATNLDNFQLPSTWDRELQVQGRTAVVLFVDRTSMGAVLNAAKGMRRENKMPIWGEGVQDKVPELGFASNALYTTVLSSSAKMIKGISITTGSLIPMQRNFKLHSTTI